MKALLVTSWGIACGVAEHSAMMKDAIEAAGRDIKITVGQDCEGFDRLDPRAYRWSSVANYYGLVHLNYQAGLHSRFTPVVIKEMKAAGCKVLVTYHDTGVPNSEQCKAVCEASDYFVVHEPYDDLPSHGEYMRMGVPNWSLPYVINRGWGRESGTEGRPVLGTVGFNFPWKLFDRLAEITAAMGWALLILSPNATDEDWLRWRERNPWVLPRESGFLSGGEVVGRLTGCDATAFTYVCHNTGQSGAVLQGIAARKPVIALSTCRQFRALYADPLGHDTITWCETFDDVARALRTVPIQRADPGIVALAEQESWSRRGKQYASIYRGLVA